MPVSLLRLFMWKLCSLQQMLSLLHRIIFNSCRQNSKCSFWSSPSRKYRSHLCYLSEVEVGLSSFANDDAVPVEIKHSPSLHNVAQSKQQTSRHDGHSTVFHNFTCFARLPEKKSQWIDHRPEYRKAKLMLSAESGEWLGRQGSSSDWTIQQPQTRSRFC